MVEVILVATQFESIGPIKIYEKMSLSC